ncbi:TIGR03885 family FMN-dependent LLM class oxidoreductase [Naasia aerilata]|uniref:LLM class F420-dependent oxidoreductase n=1 Tax=Naasia aerilata TaxID=1162966 RepID=A0ABM8GDI6_9MICO|nr:TIGR03885 family FMN-dependent LLM class oxidoreductase [Naasia aerilata]BDZ46339.1 LLM class F420-dependent oxidoreductase [Naasia aerilata]
MTVIGFHASHEQIHPSELLRAVRRAEEVGFTGAMCSDHIAPWSVRQGQSGFAWSWLGASLERTSIPHGLVTAPGQRYHPAIVAHAAATLAAMYPDRLWVALGSGENLNEHITGDAWPAKDVRNQRLKESADVMRALLAGEEVSHDGLVTVDRARLWTLPETPPLLLGAAVSAETARWLGGWADGLATIAQPVDEVRKVSDAFRDGGGTGPLVLQVHVSYAKTDEEALAIAHEQWRANNLPPDLAWDLDAPEAFDERTKDLPTEATKEAVLVSSDLGWHVGKLTELMQLGFDEVYLHHVGQQQDEFLDAFGEHVLPQLPVTARATR